MFWILSLLLSLQSYSADPSLASKKEMGKTYFEQLTGDNADSEKNQWNKIYGKKIYVYGKQAAPFLAKHLKDLPLGKALDLAMGEGRNAVFLAKKGFQVDGVDISPVAIRKAKTLAYQNHVRIHTITADLGKYQIAPESYDVILDFYFMQRSLIPMIKKGLKRGGVVVFEAYTPAQLKYDKGENRNYMVEKGELKTLFKDFEVIQYQDTDNGTEAYASIIARKR